jgi:hypothetical protein
MGPLAVVCERAGGLWNRACGWLADGKKPADVSVDRRGLSIGIRG